MISNYSPTTQKAYTKDPEWFNKYSNGKTYDPEGYDCFGYNKEDGCDRAKNTEFSYNDFNGDTFYNNVLKTYDFDGEKPIDIFDRNYREIIITNKCQCKLCDDIIESKFTNSFVNCKCGEIFTDGGKSYIRRGANDLNNIIDLSETIFEKKSKVS